MARIIMSSKQELYEIVLLLKLLQNLLSVLLFTYENEYQKSELCS